MQFLPSVVEATPANVCPSRVVAMTTLWYSIVDCTGEGERAQSKKVMQNIMPANTAHTDTAHRSIVASATTQKVPYQSLLQTAWHLL